MPSPECLIESRDAFPRWIPHNISCWLEALDSCHMESTVVLLHECPHTTRAEFPRLGGSGDSTVEASQLLWPSVRSHLLSFFAISCWFARLSPIPCGRGEHYTRLWMPGGGHFGGRPPHIIICTKYGEKKTVRRWERGKGDVAALWCDEVKGKTST